MVKAAWPLRKNADQQRIGTAPRIAPEERVMSGNVVNLNQARKARAKADKSAKAASNRALHGQTKVEKAKLANLADRLSQALDGAKRDPKD
jgi:hypothetical protein